MQVATEGGSLSIVRYLTAGKTWQFAFIKNESVLADFLEEDDQQDLFKSLDSIATFADALALMDHYPWQYFYPLVVHPEYADLVKGIIAKSGPPQVQDNWQHFFSK